jgi:hypothetical protein
MGWKLSDLPGPHNRDFPVEQATAAPGEKRNVEGVPCRHLLDHDLVCTRCSLKFEVVRDRDGE